MLWASMLVAGVGNQAGAPRTLLVTVVGVVAAGAGWGIRPSSSLVPSAIGVLVVNGFVLNRYGVLSWHGWADLGVLLALTAAGVVAAEVSAAVAGHGRVGDRLVVAGHSERARHAVSVG